MDREELERMGAYSMKSALWKDVRDTRVYSIQTLVRTDKPLSIAATGEDLESRDTKKFTTDDFLRFLTPIRE